MSTRPPLLAAALNDIETALIHATGTSALLTTVANNLDDGERDDCIETIERHLRRDMAAMRDAFDKAHHASCSVAYAQEV
jgi:hypothetical protein